MSVRVIVVAENQSLRDIYQNQASQYGVQCDCASSLSELFEILKESAYNGLLVDLPTVIRASEAEKNLLHDLQQTYPILRIRWDENIRQLRCLLYGSKAGSGLTLQTFIDEHCRNFKARRIRRHERVPLHLKVLLSRSGSFDAADIERATTLDVSQGGCALLTSQEWPARQTIWLKILDLNDQSPIMAETRRWIPWETPLRLPSLGVKFLSLSSSQQQQLADPRTLERTLRNG